MGFASFNTGEPWGIRGDEHDPRGQIQESKGDILGQVEYAREIFGVAAWADCKDCSVPKVLQRTNQTHVLK